MRVPPFIKDLLPLCSVVGCCLMYLQIVMSYTYERQLSGAMLKVAGLAYSDWGMLIIFGSAALLMREGMPLIRRPLILAVLIATGMALIIGFPQAIARTMMVNDLRITAAFLCGVVFAVSLRHSRLWHWHLLILQALLVLLMYKAYRDATFGEVFVAGVSGGSRLATTNSIGSVGSACLICTALLLSFVSARKFWMLPLAILLYLPVFYMAVISSGTRSALIAPAVALPCALFVRAYWRGGVGLLRAPSLARLLGLGAAASAISALFIYRYRNFIYEQALLFISRFKGEGMADQSSSLRIMEIEALFKGFNLWEWIVGRGVGGTFASPIYDGGLAPTVHVGVFTFLLKFGLPVFLAIVVILYIRLPYRFARAILFSSSEISRRREAIMLVFAAMIPLISTLSLSGGYGRGAMFWWGLLSGLFMLLQRDGVSAFIPLSSLNRDKRVMPEMGPLPRRA